ncbi:hypothetical protein [Phenylobacterium sp.]|uniref:hypothetical protein n=1 Tax=Phenylobacterium sp. TaxID=1871053 RepID=UPI0035B368EE
MIPSRAASARIFIILAGAALAVACQTTQGAEAREPPAPEAATTTDTMGDAMRQPLTDLNIAPEEIPTALKEAAAAPYAAPADGPCAAIAEEIGRLDGALGPDLDAAAPAEPGQGVKLAAGALRSLTTGWIPFRGVLRHLTGAEAHAEAVREAVLAGAVRRAYLKGLGEKQGCTPPAAPQRQPAPAAP